MKIIYQHALVLRLVEASRLVLTAGIADAVDASEARVEHIRTRGIKRCDAEDLVEHSTFVAAAPDAGGHAGGADLHVPDADLPHGAAVALDVKNSDLQVVARFTPPRFGRVGAAYLLARIYGVAVFDMIDRGLGTGHAAEFSHLRRIARAHVERFRAQRHVEFGPRA